MRKLRDRILKGEDFAGIASTSSEDPGSAPDGGDLGWSGPGTFVPEFDKAIADLKVNEISEPFKTRYGWHIVQMLGTRTYDSTDDVRRQKAFAAIRESKADEETELWLRALTRRGLRRNQDVGARSGVHTAHRHHVGGTRRYRVRMPASAWRKRDWDADLVVAADVDLLAATAASLGLAPDPRTLTTSSQPPAKSHRAGTLKVMHIPTRRQVIAGQPDARNAAYVIEMLDRACDGCMQRRICRHGDRARAKEHAHGCRLPLQRPHRISRGQDPRGAAGDAAAQRSAAGRAGHHAPGACRCAARHHPRAAARHACAS